VKTSLKCAYLGMALLVLGGLLAARPLFGSMQEQTQKQEKKVMDVDVGEGMSADDAKALEEMLIINPNSLYVRGKLIHYYFEAGIKSRSSEFEGKREQQVFWLIENHPEAELAGSPEAGILGFDSKEDQEAFEHAKGLWMQAIIQHPQDLRVLHNAAEFLSLSDPEAALEVLQKAMELNPNDTQTLGLLARTYETKEHAEKSAQDRAAMALKALGLRERELESEEEPMRSFALVEVTTDAFDANDMVKAEKYANELLTGAEGAKGNWNYGNVIFEGNTVLGRVKLRSGDVAGAKQHLLAAGKTPGSPQLNSFGPNMSLAKELLEKGERETVIAYLQECAKFWEMGQEQIQSWTVAIRKGEIPDFGANLEY
jgi:hypothetical protein